MMANALGRLGTKLRERRVQLGLTQRALAEKVGIRFTHISRVERGQSGVSVAVLTRLADVLQVTPEWLLGDAGEGKPPSPSLSAHDLSEQEGMHLSNFRRLARADQRFVSRVARALAGAERYHRPTEDIQQTHGWRALSRCDEEAPLLGDGREGVTPAMVVRGSSLVGIGVYDGDLVATASREPRPGDAVVAIVDGLETVVRQWFPLPGGRCELRSSDRTEKPLIVEAAKARVSAVVTHVWRKLAEDQHDEAD